MPEYKCKLCNYKTPNLYSFTQHMRVHTGEKPFICPICKKPFAQSSSLRKHKVTHTGKRPYTCSICKKSFTESGSCSRHKKTHAQGERERLSCRDCGTTFTRSSSLNRHIKNSRHCSSAQVITNSQPLPGGETVTCTTHTVTIANAVMTVSQLNSSSSNALVTTIEAPSAITTTVLQNGEPAVTTTESIQGSEPHFPVQDVLDLVPDSEILDSGSVNLQLPDLGPLEPSDFW